MIRSLRISSLAWLAVLLGATVFLGWVQVGRVQHVRTLSALGGGPPAPAAGAIPARPAHGLIIPHGLAASQHWMLQTGQMFIRREWRVRTIDYENAPNGRSVSAASPYRWWLGLVAWTDQRWSGRSIAASLERAALCADPLLHLLLLAGTTVLVAWRFGAFSAALTAPACVIVFPLAAGFAGGAPDDSTLTQVLACWSVLLLAAGLGGGTDSPGRERWWFIAAGVVGGLGLWVDPLAQLPLLGGVVAGAALAVWLDRREPTGMAGLPWRAWAAGGAVATLGACLIEFWPDHLTGWRLAPVHPLYGVAWLGAGEWLVRLPRALREGRRAAAWRSWVGPVLAAMAVVGPLAVLWQYQDRAALIPDPLAFRLSRLMDAVDARAVLIAVLPLSLAVPAVWVLGRAQTPPAVRRAAAIVVGPLLVAVGLACRQLAWWSQVDAILLVLVAVVTSRAALASGRGFGPRGWSVLAILVLAPGLWFVVPRGSEAAGDRLSRPEMLGLIERDLAGWLAQHSAPGSVVVLAPPHATTALCYYGGLRGIGSLSWENKEGVAAAVRIFSAPSAQEAKELVDQRGITHLVLLSWDGDFDAYARSGTGRSEGTFRDQLRFPTLPRWLRPLSYAMPTIEGFEGETVSVLAVVDEQDEATALTGVAEYLLETAQREPLEAVEQALQQFPAALGAWVARAEIQQARGDETEFAKSLDMLKRRLASTRPPPLAWGQRVRLATVLGKAKEMTLAREQVARCIESADEEKLRALPAGALYRLLVLSRHFELQLEPGLQAVALELLPVELRERLK